MLRTEGVEEVALILVAVQAAQHAGLLVKVAAYVVAGGDVVGAQIFGGKLEESLELDFLVAQDIGIGGTPGLVFRQKMLEHVVPVFGGKVDGMQLDAELVAHRLSVPQIFGGRAELVGVVFFPVFHEQAFNLIALLLQQIGRNGRIHTAGHADNHF